jgi:lysophosphatidic acid acyltransferase/lysophosphatidylinositol acyltransferase
MCFHDPLLLFGVAARAQRLSQVKFFTKEEIRGYGPWGWAIQLLGFIFVKRNWTHDETWIREAFADIWKTPEIPVFIISFLEGRRYTQERHEQAVRFAQEVLRFKNSMSLTLLRGIFRY